MDKIDTFYKYDITKLPRHMIRNLFKNQIKYIRTNPLFVYDGDTLDICFEYNNDIYRETVRIKGYDSPEIRTKNAEEKIKAKQAKVFLQNIIKDETQIMIGKFDSTDKWGRLLADIYLFEKKEKIDMNEIIKQIEKNEELIILSELMISNGHGYAYFGKTKRKYTNK